ncbi:MAG: type I DNA topoisomerase [Patescibacteria group bacterium]|jgi:DNA topoisomerase-1|nr:type I DNA topoisomerase [Patescibacteria group bacterium]
MPVKNKKKNLVIVESPTKAKTISRFLTVDYFVEASYGHVRDLPKSKLGIDIENDFKPQYIIIRKNQKQLTKLKKIAEKSSEIILATDEDREGEAIAWHLKETLLNNNLSDKNIKRIAFHEITESAIKNALLNPRDINMNLVFSQQARRILDRLVGYLLSPFLWKKIFHGLSAGRVQSAALHLIVERENERKKFQPEEYWTISADFLTGSKKCFCAHLYKINEKVLGKFDIKKQKDAEEIVDKLKKADFIINKIEEKLTQKNPLPPFITSTLQQEAWKKLHFSAKQTMLLAQKLYEGIDFGKGPTGLITYMRTDSVNLSEESLNKAKEVIINQFSEKYYNRRQFINKSRLAQEAHEAIRPTDPNILPEKIKGRVDNKLYKLYTLIWQRFIASQMAPAQIKKLLIDIKAKNDDDVFFLKTIGSQLIFDGFLKVYPIKFEENELPPLQENQKLLVKKVVPLQHFTEPPPRYSEASLIKTLEDYGIGRPSTYATIISILKERRYVELDENKKFIPTEIGILVDDILTQHFPQIIDIGFTAKIEEDLDKIADGKINWQDVIREFYLPFKENLDKKYIEVAKNTIEEKTNEKCELCGAEMVIKYGRYGKFLACSNFPKCKNTKSLMNNNNHLTELKCPKCNDGYIVIRKTKKGRIFYGCSRYPECNYASWTKPESQLEKNKE